MLKIRSGIGYDIHRITKGNQLLIGGVEVSRELRFISHSDGDVLLHALIDSLLGAAGLPDIGELFPDSDPQYKGISSDFLLKEVLNRLTDSGFEIVNMDCTVVAQRPSLSPFKEAIRKKLSLLLQIPGNAIGVKAKTREGLGAVGEGDAIECYCISMIRATSIQ